MQSPRHTEPFKYFCLMIGHQKVCFQVLQLFERKLYEKGYNAYNGVLNISEIFVRHLKGVWPIGLST